MQMQWMYCTWIAAHWELPHGIRIEMYTVVALVCGCWRCDTTECILQCELSLGLVEILILQGHVAS